MCKILIIEDDPALTSIYREWFKRHEIVAVDTLDAAREYLRDNCPTVVLLDLCLPDGNGIDFLTEENPALLMAGVVVVSSLSLRSEERAFLLSQGIVAFVPKPFEPIEIFEAVKKAVRCSAALVANALTLNIGRAAMESLRKTNRQAEETLERVRNHDGHATLT